MFSQTRTALEQFDNQHDFERMAADILNAQGYTPVVLIAPRGGSDEGKDIAFTTESGGKGLACVTLREDIQRKFEEDFSQRKAGEYEKYMLFCRAHLSAQQKRTFAKYCLETLEAEFIPFDIEALRSLLDSSLKSIRERYLHIKDESKGVHEEALVALRDKIERNNSSVSKREPSNSLTIEEVISLWLDEIGSNKKTREQYEDAITHYRDMLRKYGLDLNSENEEAISTRIQKWANSSWSGSGKKVEDATYNSRIAAIHNFYTFACENDWLTSNPIKGVKRRKEKRHKAYDAGNTFGLDTIAQTINNGLRLIDRNEPLGKRDYALLSLLFATRHRASEVRDLTCGDIQIDGKSVKVTWRNDKEELSPVISLPLIEYLETAFGSVRPHDAPLWKSYSPQNRGSDITLQTFRYACNKYLKIHSLEKIRQSLKALREREGQKGFENKLFLQ